ncbi:1,3-beta-glucan synthase regulator [Bacillus thuringiensis]|uniref:SMI1/KNR4 family protein n=1 Tax=Bacillus thuringiensis TaxID=1428 RepID=UPI000BEE18BF|nr:SMI1/KNR4 family protein [Bacillus thuringiensis]PEC16809.1 1,3-beta-glucan synthase regulator [Bacillus thuringiensis]PEV08097.1 1,3-beta-glucan synthase regulator [Bacillus thuringiensis]PFC42461.1 1,3-beta-glucan synthase regulator [Bacillus thuringiensis]PGV69963.1 1,3-beta-glucan synthase regulator [Bacillus thuringiensis]PGW56197.1 1,3-beta-glucan synthase regulator [Bacillus thuringiensis]
MKEVREYIEIKKQGVLELQIKETEEKLGAAFSNQYRDLIKLVNNAEIGEWVLYPIKDNRNVTKTWDDIVRQNVDMRDEYISENLIIIGDDGSGDKLCFKINNGKMDDQIYIWYHADDEMEEICPSLKEFIMETIQEDDAF